MKFFRKKVLNSIVTLCVDMIFTFSPQRFISDFESASIQIHFSGYQDFCMFLSLCKVDLTQSIGTWCLSLLFSSSERELKNDELKSADYWLSGAIDFALPHLIKATWINLMDEYTLNRHKIASCFIDFIVSTYVERGSAQFDTDLWNVYESIVNHQSRRNNHVKGYNRRTKAQLPTYAQI